MDPKEQSNSGFWTPNISDWPSDAAVCSLLQVLESDSIPPRYFLREKACAGILSRVEARGKKLPDQLLSALRSSTDADTPSTKSLGQYACPKCEGGEGPAVGVVCGVPAFGGHSLSGSVERSAMLTAKEARLDIDSEAFLVAPTLAGGARTSGGYSYDDVPCFAATLDESLGDFKATPARTPTMAIVTLLSTAHKIHAY
jgi:hypothetical protein